MQFSRYYLDHKPPVCQTWRWQSWRICRAQSLKGAIPSLRFVFITVCMQIPGFNTWLPLCLKDCWHQSDAFDVCRWVLLWLTVCFLWLDWVVYFDYETDSDPITSYFLTAVILVYWCMSAALCDCSYSKQYYFWGNNKHREKMYLWSKCNPKNF